MSGPTTETEKHLSAFRAVAPAKINLTLQVLGQRDDGFHDLCSVVIGVDRCDRLRVRPSHNGAIEITGSPPSIPTETNLAYRAARLLARRLRTERGAVIELDKRIPIAAGLGGGSSDAATTLRLCNRLWSGGLSDVDLASLGLEIGSDVPLFFHLPAARMEGRGERVRSLPLSWSGWVLLAFVDAAVSTAAVYRAWRPADAEARPPLGDDVWTSLGRSESVMDVLFNDLEAAVFRTVPEVASAFESVASAGLGPFRVSGAGSTLYRLFDGREPALKIARKLQDLNVFTQVLVVRAPVSSAPQVSEE